MGRWLQLKLSMKTKINSARWAILNLNKNPKHCTFFRENLISNGKTRKCWNKIISFNDPNISWNKIISFNDPKHKLE